MPILKRSLYVLPLLCAFAFFVGSVQAGGIQIKDTVKKSYDVEPGGTLRLDIDHGNIEVNATPENRVMIELERIADAEDREKAERILAQHEYAFDQRGPVVTIHSRFEQGKGMLSRWRGKSQLKVRVIVKVPERYNVDFKSGAGNVQIADVEGRIEGRTGAGTITLDDVRAVVDISSGAGNVSIEGEVAQGEVNTGAGNIHLTGLTGAIEANTGAGNVIAEITEQPTQSSSLSSGAGNVTVYLSNAVGVYVKATSSLGGAECDFPVKMEGKWLKRSFSGEINGGGPELRLHAGVGSVALKRE